MTPLTWLTIYYQAACRQFHLHSVDGHRKDLATGPDSCMLRLDGGNVGGEENVAGSSAGSSAGVLERYSNCGCAECFLHVPQYSQQAYLQIARVSFSLCIFPCTTSLNYLKRDD